MKHRCSFIMPLLKIRCVRINKYNSNIYRQDFCVLCNDISTFWWFASIDCYHAALLKECRSHFFFSSGLSGKPEVVTKKKRLDCVEEPEIYNKRNGD